MKPFTKLFQRCSILVLRRIISDYSVAPLLKCLGVCLVRQASCCDNSVFYRLWEEVPAILADTDFSASLREEGCHQNTHPDKSTNFMMTSRGCSYSPVPQLSSNHGQKFRCIYLFTEYEIGSTKILYCCTHQENPVYILVVRLIVGFVFGNKVLSTLHCQGCQNLSIVLYIAFILMTPNQYIPFNTLYRRLRLCYLNISFLKTVTYNCTRGL